MEMVIATALLLIGLSVFVSTLVMSTEATYTARNALIGLNYARLELEKAKTYVYGDPYLAVGTTTITNSMYTGQKTIAQIGAVTNRMKSISIRINWVNPELNITTNVVFTTLMSSCMH